MSPYLSRRLATAFIRGNATMAEGDALVAAAGPPEVLVMADLPRAAYRLLRHLETRRLFTFHWRH